MADELARPKIVLEVNHKEAIAAFVATGEASKDLGAAIAALSKQFEAHTERSAKSETSIKKLMDTLSGTGASKRFEELAEAVNRFGGVEKLTATQTEQLAKQMERLKAAGGTVPASLQGVAKSAEGLGAAFGKMAPNVGLTQAAASQAAGSMQGLAGQLGPLGSMLGALGPYGMAAAAGIAALSAAGAGLVKVLADSVVGAVNYASRISDMQARNKIGAESLQVLALSASMVGADVGDLTKAIDGVNKALVNSPEQLESLGLNLKELEAMSPDQKLLAVVAALQDIEDPARRDVIGLEILGKKFHELEALTAGLKGGVDKFASENGLKQSQSLVDGLDEVGDAAGLLSKTWEGLWNNIGATIAATPGLKEGILELARGIGSVSQTILDNQAGISQFFSNMVAGLRKIYPEINGAIVALKGLQAATTFVASGGKAIHFGVVADIPKEPGAAGAGLKGSAKVGVELAGPPAPPGKGAGGKTHAELAEEKAAAKAASTAADAASNAATALSIKLTNELAAAQANLGVGLDGTLAKIKAHTDAKIAEINANKQWDAATKAGLASQAEAIGKAQAAAAQSASAHKMAELAAKVRAETEAILNKTLEAGMTPLQVQLTHIEAKRAADVAAAEAVVAKAKAEGDDTAVLEANTDEQIKAINAAAEGEATHQQELQTIKDVAEAHQVEAASTAIVNKFQKEYAAIVDKGSHSLENQIRKIEAQGEAHIDAAAAAWGASNITTEAYFKAKEQIEAATAASIEFAKIQDTVSKIKGVGKIAGELASLSESLGIGGKVGNLLGQVQGVTDSVGDFITAKDPLSKIAAGIKVAKGVFDFGKTLITGPSESEKIAKDVARDFGVKISDELAKTIEKEGKGRFDGALMHLGEMIGEAGGLEKFGAGRAAGAMRDLFSAVDRGTVTLDEAGKVFDETFGEVAASQVSKTTGIATAQLRELVLLAKDFGLESEALREFQKGQATGLAGGLAGGLASMKSAREGAGDKAGTAAERRARNLALEAGRSQEEAEAAGRAAGARAGRAAQAGAGLAGQGAASAISNAILGDFAAMEQAGMTTAEAMAAIAPAVKSMREELKVAGLEGGAAFAALEERIRVTTDEVTGPLVAGVGSFASSLVNLHNLNMLTAEDFAGITTQIGANILALDEQGVKGVAAAQALQPDLQKVWELQQATGFAVDQTTQNLLDQAVEAGMVGEAHKSAADKMADASERTASAVEFLAARFGYLAEEMNKVPSEKNIRVNTEFTSSGSGVPPGGYAPGQQPEGFAGGTDGFRNFGTQTPVFLHGMEAVITPTDFRSIAETSMAAGAALMARGAMQPDSMASVSASMDGIYAPGGGPTGVVGGTSTAGGSIVININGAAKDPKQIADEVAYVLTRGRSPALLDEIRKRART